MTGEPANQIFDKGAISASLIGVAMIILAGLAVYLGEVGIGKLLIPTGVVLVFAAIFLYFAGADWT